MFIPGPKEPLIMCAAFQESFVWNIMYDPDICKGVLDLLGDGYFSGQSGYGSGIYQSGSGSGYSGYQSGSGSGSYQSGSGSYQSGSGSGNPGYQSGPGYGFSGASYSGEHFWPHDVHSCYKLFVEALGDDDFVSRLQSYTVQLDFGENNQGVTFEVWDEGRI